MKEGGPKELIAKDVLGMPQTKLLEPISWKRSIASIFTAERIAGPTKSNYLPKGNLVYRRI